MHDPTVFAWLVVVLYGAGVFLTFAAAQAAANSRDRAFWLCASAVLLLLGLNKQLDLQTVTLDVVRDSARAHGWYAQRRAAQALFLIVLGIALAALSVAMIVWLSGTGPMIRLAAVGILLLLIFIMLRAASFHHIDAWLRVDVSGLRRGWWLELAGIAFVGLSAAASLGLSGGARRGRRSRR